MADRQMKTVETMKSKGKFHFKMLLNIFKQTVDLFLVWLGSHVIIVMVSYNHVAGAHNGNGSWHEAIL